MCSGGFCCDLYSHRSKQAIQLLDVHIHLYSGLFDVQKGTTGEPAVTRENNCLNAAKACNLNDTCKKYRSAYISPCTSRVSTAEVCNKRKCHKALRQFFDKVPPKHSYGMLFCSCPPSDQSACSERRRQTIVPVCSYEEKQKPNCLEVQGSCKTNYICRSRLADFFANCQPEPRSLSGCLKENYADCLLAYSGLIGTVMTPNYLRSPKISVSPYCDCSSSGNNKDECDKFTEFFTDNTCLRNAIQAFGNGTDVGVWQPMPPVQTTTSTTTPFQRNRERNPNTIDNHINTDPGIYHFCGSLQAQKLKSNSTVDGVFCVDPQIDGPSTSNVIPRNSAVPRWPPGGLVSLLPPLLWLWYCDLPALSSAATL
ncbi:GDNF family receptor alpha-1-like [Centroberyx affinis]|uniref:GDNF family receptor alpha-1-like n=1 Tax=Centroberyx affinis TaxID=166261 RepID=UPI003A5C496E